MYDAPRQALYAVGKLDEQFQRFHYDPARSRVLSNDLQEVSLEATFAIARGATSRRLGDYLAQKAAAAPGAPDVRCSRRACIGDRSTARR